VCSLLPPKKVSAIAGVSVTSFGPSASLGVEVCNYDFKPRVATDYPYIRVYLYSQGAASGYSSKLAGAGKSAEHISGVGSKAFADSTDGLMVLSGKDLIQVWGAPGQAKGQFKLDIALAKALITALR
jgi:hypothetical protein